MKLNKKIIPLILVICLAVFFRFYRFSDFQYYSMDDEILMALVRNIVFDHKIVLASPNVEILFSLGSAFHWLTALLFTASGRNLLIMFGFGSSMGVLTAGVLYWVGKQLFNAKVGFIAGFLYAGSFVTGLFDRRWWTLSLDPIIATLSIYFVHNFVKTGKKRYVFLFSLLAGMAFHADPTLLLLWVFAFMMVLINRTKYWKNLLVVFPMTGIVVLPLVIYYIRHPETFFGPLASFISKFGSGHAQNSFNLFSFIQNYLAGVGRFLLPQITSFSEKYVCHCTNVPQPLFLLPMSIAIIGLLIIFFVKKQTKVLSALVVSGYVAIHFITTLFYKILMNKDTVSAYFLILMPGLFLLLAYCLNIVFEKNRTGRIITTALLVLFLLVNLQVQVFSKMQYPLAKKIAAVDQILKKTRGEPFSLHFDDNSGPLANIGGIFMSKNMFPANRDYFVNEDWLYQAYSLYPENAFNKPVYDAYVYSDQSAEIKVQVTKIE